MAILPVFDRGMASNRDKIVGIVADNPKITTKKIHHLLRKNFAVNITYQAVHKTMKQLMQQRLIIISGNNYSINPEWLTELKRFCLKNELNLSDGDSRTLNDVRTFDLNNLKQFDDFYYKLRNRLVDEMEKHPEEERIIFYHLPHCYYALAYPMRETEFMVKLAEKKARIYFLSRGRNAIDRYIKNFYKGSKAEVIVGCEAANSREVWVFPGVIYEVYYSYRFNELFNKLYKETNDIGKIEFHDFIKKIYSINDPIQIVENRNKLTVETLTKFSYDVIKKYSESKETSITIPIGNPLAKETRYHVKISDSNNKAFNNIKTPFVFEQIKKEMERRGLKGIEYEDCGRIYLDNKSKILEPTKGSLRIFRLNGMSGFIRKDNPLTWRFGNYFCEQVRQVTGTRGFISSDELSSIGGQKLAYGFNRHDFKMLFEFGHADVKKDLLILLAYNDEKAEQVFGELMKMMTSKLGMQAVSIKGKENAQLKVPASKPVKKKK